MKKIIICFTAIFLLVIFILFVFRNSILNHFVNNKIFNFNKNNSSCLKIESVKFFSLNKIKLDNISIISSNNKDTLLNISNIQCSFNLLSLLTGVMNINGIFIKDAQIHIINKNGYNNYKHVLANFLKNQNSQSKIQISNWSEYIDNIFLTLFNRIPDRAELQNLVLNTQLDDTSIIIKTDNLSFKNKIIYSIIKISEKQKICYLRIKGDIDKRDKMLNISLLTAENKKIFIPYLKEKWNFIAEFDSLKIKISKGKLHNEILHINSRFTIHNSQLNHPKISLSNVNLGNIFLNFNFNISTNSIELDSTSEIDYNKLNFNPYFKYSLINSKEITLVINKIKLNATSLFESLPKGMFANLQGIKTRGELSYYLKFHLNFDQPDSLYFYSELKKFNFRIEHYGQTDFSRMNQQFSYTAYDKGLAIKTFIVGADNPEFLSYDKIPLKIKNSVMTEEDGGFFYHKGFNADAFRQSIIKNIKEKRFARGGSTITMQLVKNLFLNKNKTLSRKMEEALIVWLIENNNISSKERMLEIYFNIIEWGPGVYGLTAASKFYFNKKPSQLNLAESIFLTQLIPHPKWFKYSFDENGNLKEYIINFYKFLSYNLLKKNLITQEEYDKLIPAVSLKGEARLQLMEKLKGKKEFIEEKLNENVFDFEE